MAIWGGAPYILVLVLSQLFQYKKTIHTAKQCKTVAGCHSAEALKTPELNVYTQLHSLYGHLSYSISMM